MLNFSAAVLKGRPPDGDTGRKGPARVGIRRIPFAFGVPALPANLRPERVSQTSAEHFKQGRTKGPAFLWGSNFTEVVAPLV